MIKIIDCDYCRGSKCCPSMNHGQACTRVPGHKGDHISCGTRTHIIKQWSDAKHTKKVKQIIIVFDDGSYKGYNRKAFETVFKIHIDGYLRGK